MHHDKLPDDAHLRMREVCKMIRSHLWKSATGRGRAAVLSVCLAIVLLPGLPGRGLAAEPGAVSYRGGLLQNIPGGGNASDQMQGGQMLPGGSASVEVYAFKDSNDNGAAGKYEKPIEGVEVTVLMHVGGGQTAVAGHGVTGADGRTTILGLGDGTYTIRSQLPEGYGYARRGQTRSLTASIMDTSVETVQETEPMTITSPESVQVGIGILTMSKVTGYAWFDENGDGIRQGGEAPLSGVAVEMEGVKSGFVYQTATGEDGTYTVAQIRPGTYKLRFKAPEGHAFTVYSRTGGDARSIITTEGRSTGSKEVKLSPGEVLNQQNVGFISDAGIFGRAFLDANYNGLYDEGEEPLPGVELEVYRQIMDKPIAKGKSGKDGTFAFAGMRATAYRLRVILPETGVTFTKVVNDPAVVGNKLKARAGRRENTIENISLRQGERYEVAIGAIQPASISGVAYLDDDFSGTRGKKEKIVPGLVVTLRDEAGNLIASDKTNAKGKYVFDNLNPGTYVLYMAAKSGYAFSREGAGNVMKNAGGGNGQSSPIELALGENLSGQDLGMILPGVVEGMFYADGDDDGQKDEAETGLPGGKVTLVDTDTMVPVFSAYIGKDGVYRFDAVMPGRYQLTYTLPEGAIFARGTETTHTVTADGKGAAGKAFSFEVGQQMTAPLVGGLTLGSIQGTVFDDEDGDGVQSAGEKPLSGAVITLTPHRSDLSDMKVTTAADGGFQLSALHPDTYTLTFTAPEDRVISRLKGVTLPLTTGKNQVEVSLPFAMGQHHEDQHIGVVFPASLGGLAWLDENNDGARSDTERPLSGLSIRVVDDGDGETFATLTTDEDGTFVTEQLVPGTYTLRYELGEDEAAPASGSATFQQQGNGLVMPGVVLHAGEQRRDPVLGLVKHTTLGGMVWVDQEGAIAPLAGAKVALSSGGQTVQSVTTPEDGRYQFSGLLPGQYTLSLELPEGQLAVAPDDERLAEGKHISVMTSVSGRTGKSDALTLRMGEDQLKLDMGSVLPGKVGDLAWLDLNGNGLQDSDELGIPGVEIRLMKDGVSLMETTTNGYGYYHFPEVYPASYTLEVTAPKEVKPTVRVQGFPGIGSMLNQEAGDALTTVAFEVRSNARQYDVDLGFVLVTPDVYPAGYGQGQAQDWTRVRLGK